MPALWRVLPLAVAGWGLQGCSVFSPAPLWELAKLTGGLAAVAGQTRPGQVSHAVSHPHAAFSDLCIELNPRTQVPDVVPALQSALSRHRIESRVYDSPVVGARCQVWLRYSAQLQWGSRWPSDEQRPYMGAAALTLQSASGQVLASSRYEPVAGNSDSQWASTHDKLYAAVGALVSRAGQSSPNALP